MWLFEYFFGAKEADDIIVKRFDNFVNEVINENLKYNQLYSLMTSTFNKKGYLTSEYLATLTQSFVVFLLTIKGKSLEDKRILITIYLHNLLYIMNHKAGGTMHDSPNKCDFIV